MSVDTAERIKTLENTIKKQMGINDYLKVMLLGKGLGFDDKDKEIALLRARVDELTEQLKRR